MWQICVDELTQGSLILRCVTISETPFSFYGIYDWIKTFYRGENGCQNKRVRSKRAQQGVRKQGGDQCAALHPGLCRVHRTALRRLQCTMQRTIHRRDWLGNLSRAYRATLCALLAKGLLSLLCTLHTVQCTGQHYTRDWWNIFVRLLPTVSRGTVHTQAGAATQQPEAHTEHAQYISHHTTVHPTRYKSSTTFLLSWLIKYIVLIVKNFTILRNFAFATKVSYASTYLCQ